MSKVYSFQQVQIIPTTPTDAWNFFSNPANLHAITPGNLGFKVISKNSAAKIFPGMLIEYQIKPLLGIPVYWMTEITHVTEEQYFVDEQRFGPYSLWHHQHHFKQTDAGVEMTDIVHYKIPFWFAGDVINAILVKRRLKEIFDYRRKAINESFIKVPGV